MATAQGTNHKDIVSGATQVTKNARLITDQADIATIKEIPDLPTHQKAAKDQSNKWVSDIWPLIIDTTADVIDYANTFQATYTELLSLLPKLEAGDVKTKDEFVQALQIVLIQALTDKSTTANGIVLKIRQFHTDFQPLYNKFQVDFKAANDVMTKDNNAILDKLADLTMWKGKAIGYEMAAVSMGVAIPITAAATAVFSETGVGLLVGGILMAGELAALGTMLGLYAEAMHHVNDLTSDINDLQTQVAQLTTIEQQITGLNEHVQIVSTTSSDVADGWQTLKNNMDKTIGHLNEISPTDAALFIKIDLSAANKEWGLVLDQAKVLQPTGGALDSKTYESSTDMVKAIDTQAKGA